MNFFFCARYADFSPEIRKVFLRPLVASALCGGTAVGVYALLCRIVSSNLITTAFSIVSAGIVYFAAILLLGALDKEDFDFIPKGKTLYGILKKIKLVK